MALSLYGAEAGRFCFSTTLFPQATDGALQWPFFVFCSVLVFLTSDVHTQIPAVEHGSGFDLGA